jgi:hypothetical protein
MSDAGNGGSAAPWGGARHLALPANHHGAVELF